MFPGYSHDISIERDRDAADLRRLAELDSSSPIATPALVSHVDGEAVAALSLEDGRAVANPFRHTATILTILRLQASGMRAAEREPSLSKRITVQLRRRGVAPAPA
jgi:hypothetical protein